MQVQATLRPVPQGDVLRGPWDSRRDSVPARPVWDSRVSHPQKGLSGWSCPTPSCSTGTAPSTGLPGALGPTTRTSPDGQGERLPEGRCTSAVSGPTAAGNEPKPTFLLSAPVVEVTRVRPERPDPGWTDAETSGAPETHRGHRTVAPVRTSDD